MNASQSNQHISSNIDNLLRRKKTPRQNKTAGIHPLGNRSDERIGWLINVEIRQVRGNS